MKKYLYSILIAAATLAGCSQSEIEDVIPVEKETLVNECVPTYVEVCAAGDDTRATFLNGKSAVWETGDQILIVAGRAIDKAYGSGTETINGGTLTLGDGENTNSALFRGTVNSPALTTDRYFHCTYPATNTTLSTKTERTLAAVPNDYPTCGTSTTTCTLTVAAAQDGKWTPAMYASTASKIRIENISGQSVKFVNKNSAIALRIFKNDGTPKRIKSVKITAANNIVGTVSATTANDGRLNDATWNISATGNTITADNLQNVASQDGTNYDYYFEILPVDAGEITILVTDENGLQCTRKMTLTSGKETTANYCHRRSIKWDAASIDFNGTATSWYAEYAASPSNALAKGTIYVDGITVQGESSPVEVGLQLNGKNYSSTLNGDQLVVSGLASGEYTVLPYAILEGNKQIVANNTVKVNVLAEETLTASIYTSYKDKSGAKNNSLGGSNIYSEVGGLSTGAQGFVTTTVLNYGSKSASSAGFANVTPTLAYSEWGNYDCYVEVTFDNGYKINTSASKVNVDVTGIPYNYQFYDSGSNLDGWYASAGSKWQYDNVLLYSKSVNGFISKEFFIPEDITVKCNAKVKYYRGLSSKKTTIYVGSSSSAASVVQTVSKEINANITPDGTTGLNDIPGTLSMTSNTKYITISHNAPSLGAATGYIMVHTVSVEY